MRSPLRTTSRASMLMACICDRGHQHLRQLQRLHDRGAAPPARLRGTVNIDPATIVHAERMRADGIVGVRLQLRGARSCPIWQRGIPPPAAARGRSGLAVHLALESAAARCAARTGSQWFASCLTTSATRISTGDRQRRIPGVLRSVDKGRTWVKLSAGYRLTGLAGIGAPDPKDMALARQAAGRLSAGSGPNACCGAATAIRRPRVRRSTFADTCKAAGMGAVAGRAPENLRYCLSSISAEEISP